MKKLSSLFLICISHTLYAQLTFVPDDNLEAYLEANSMGNGIANDNFVSTSHIENITSLNISANNITDLTGIEDFTALKELYCYENLLTDLDLSMLPLLERIDASKNLILNTNLTQNPNLILISINENFLTNIDISKNPNLVTLYLDSNSLTTIDLTKNPLLEKISCSNNRLTSLNIKNGANTNITTFVTVGNPDLSCIQVDDAVYSTTNWTNIDIISSFIEDCGSVLSTSSTLLDMFSFFPNPVSNIMRINSELNNFEYALFTMHGQELTKSNSKISKEISFEDFVAGIYILRIRANDQNQSFKIIKN